MWRNRRRKKILISGLPLTLRSKVKEMISWAYFKREPVEGIDVFTSVLQTFDSGVERLWDILFMTILAPRSKDPHQVQPCASQIPDLAPHGHPPVGYPTKSRSIRIDYLQKSSLNVDLRLLSTPTPRNWPKGNKFRMPPVSALA